MNDKQSNIFERNPQKTLIFIFFILFLSLTQFAEYFLSRQYYKDRKGLGGKRSIRLRENQPGQDKFIFPDSEYMMNVDSLVVKNYHFRTDNNGFIRPTDVNLNPDYKIFFLGGSTTECKYVDEDLRYPYYVAKIMESKTGLKINSYNGGVSGNNSMHSNDILLNKLIPLKPDFVILHHNINDIIILLIQGAYWNNHFNRSLIYTEKLAKDVSREFTIHAKLKGIKNLLFPNLYQRIKILFDDSAQEKPDEWKKFRGKKLSINNLFIISEFKKSLKIFIDICRTHQIIPVLMTQASRLKKKPDQLIKKIIFKFNKNFGIEYDKFREIHREMNQSIRQLALNNNVILIDLEAEVPQKNLYIYDVGHYNNKGSKYVAKIIANKLYQKLSTTHYKDDKL